MSLRIKTEDGDIVVANVGGGGSDVDAYPAMFMAQYLPFDVFYGTTGATVLNDEIYIAKTESGNTLLFKFNGSAWEKLSSFNYSSSYYSGSQLVTLNNELYILVDRYVSSTNYDFNIYKFNFDNKNWTKITTYDRSSIAYSSVVVLNNQMHIIGGDRSGTTKHLVFDGKAITSSVSIPYKFYNGRAVVYNNEIHIFGSNTYATEHYKFDGNSWYEVSELPYDFYNGNAFVLNNKIHLIGFQGNNSRAISRYSKSNISSEWTKEYALPYNSLGSVVVERKGIIYILGGYEYVQCWYKDVETYGTKYVNRMILTV